MGYGVRLHTHNKVNPKAVRDDGLYLTDLATGQCRLWIRCSHTLSFFFTHSRFPLFLPLFFLSLDSSTYPRILSPTIHNLIYLNCLSPFIHHHSQIPSSHTLTTHHPLMHDTPFSGHPLVTPSSHPLMTHHLLLPL